MECLEVSATYMTDHFGSINKSAPLFIGPVTLLCLSFASLYGTQRRLPRSNEALIFTMKKGDVLYEVCSENY